MSGTTKDEQAQSTSRQSESSPPNKAFREIRTYFRPPEPFNVSKILEEADRAEKFQQAAGHSGFMAGGNLECLKPINIKCVRGRREHLFYQMVALFKDRTDLDSKQFFYKDFKLFVDPAKPCECRIDPISFRTVHEFLPQFKHLKLWALHSDGFRSTPELQQRFEDQLYSETSWCPCYGEDKEAKQKCASDYNQENYICMIDHHAHCKKPCISDIKMGRITFDPMASKSKVKEQTEKYPRLVDFGFRILGMKTPHMIRDKQFGRNLMTQEQVFEALESFFQPLENSQRKVIVIGRMLDILERLLEWFETYSCNQIRFYSSSILFVYDAAADSDKADAEDQHILRASVRVAMIDFAHVFHSHDAPAGPSRSGSTTYIFNGGEQNKDDNYLYGLRRLIKFFIMLNRQHRARVAEVIVPSQK
jgi:1D-myo-inositol-tetrakisphosphate 5-kinase/inositol-polyphosphate multikinase